MHLRHKKKRMVSILLNLFTGRYNKYERLYGYKSLIVSLLTFGLGSANFILLLYTMLYDTLYEMERFLCKSLLYIWIMRPPLM
jgi:hypothetical protein